MLSWWKHAHLKLSTAAFCNPEKAARKLWSGQSSALQFTNPYRPAEKTTENKECAGLLEKQNSAFILKQENCSFEKLTYNWNIHQHFSLLLLHIKLYVLLRSSIKLIQINPRLQKTEKECNIVFTGLLPKWKSWIHLVIFSLYLIYKPGFAMITEKYEFPK